MSIVISTTLPDCTLASSSSKKKAVPPSPYSGSSVFNLHLSKPISLTVSSLFFIAYKLLSTFLNW